MVNLGDQTPIGGIWMADRVFGYSLLEVAVVNLRWGSGVKAVVFLSQRAGFKKGVSNNQDYQARLHDESLELSGALERIWRG